MKNFVVYKSGAGSGKTFTLVKEYLRLALYDPDRLEQNYRRILAVTFTNKAAAEMKSRVITALDEIAHKKKLSTTGDLLCRELGITSEELRRRASATLTHLLHHYSDFAIGTIDSFTHKIVRTFAQELDLPVNFNVETDAATFYERVIAQLISRVGEDEQVSRLLKEYVLSRAEDNSFWDPESSMREFAALLMKEEAGAYLEQLAHFTAADLEAFHVQFREFIRHFRQVLKEGGQRGLDLISKEGLSDDDFIYKKSGPQNFFRKCATGEASLEDARGARITQALTHDKWAGSGPNENIVRALSAQLSRVARDLVAFIEEHYSFFALCSTLSKQMYALMLLRKIEEITRQQKKDDRIVFISEFNDKIQNLIGEEPTPFIYERLGERYRHFLLDEFQDTSSLQWQNLLPLLDNALGGGWYNLVVGDGKQSIYRWRNANVRQFASLPALPEGLTGALNQERSRSLARNFEEKILDRNYRSASTIVHFNNVLFEKLKSLSNASGISGIYDQHQQKVHNAEEGYITVSHGMLPAEELDEVNYRETLAHIRSALEDGYRYRDICILCRRNLHGNNIAGFLVGNKVPVVSSDSLLLKNNLEVNTILSYLRTLVNPREQVSAAAVITYMHHSGRLERDHLDRLLKRVSAGEPLQQILADENVHLERSDTLYNLSDHCLNLVRALDLHKGAHQYVRFFLDEVNEFLVMHNPSISSFLEWWETRKKNASLIVPPSTDAVKIMTIHAGKGLEFPVVIVPYCNWAVYKATQTWVKVDHAKVALPVSVVQLSKKAEASGFGEQLQREQNEQLLDNLNLLYVALTRASERMHLICHQSKGQTGETISSWITGQLSQITSKGSENFHYAGTRHKRAINNAEPGNVFALDPLSFDVNRDAVRIKSTLPAGDRRGEALSHGTMIHALLALITHSGDIEKAVEKGLSEGWYPASDAPALEARIRKLLTRDDLKELFSVTANGMTERELVTAAGEVLRPDRVVAMGEEAVIVDYKTGSELTARHARQMELYAEALREMGYKKIKKLLVYLDTDHVVEVN